MGGQSGWRYKEGFRWRSGQHIVPEILSRAKTKFHPRLGKWISGFKWPCFSLQNSLSVPQSQSVRLRLQSLKLRCIRHTSLPFWTERYSQQVSKFWRCTTTWHASDKHSRLHQARTRFNALLLCFRARCGGSSWLRVCSAGGLRAQSPVKTTTMMMWTGEASSQVI